jgi:hypothetical protein
MPGPRGTRFVLLGAVVLLLGLMSCNGCRRGEMERVESLLNALVNEEVYVWVIPDGNPCNRKLQLSPSTNFVDNRVNFHVLRQGNWMDGDQIYIERKDQTQPTCFANEPLVIQQDGTTESLTPVLEICKPPFPDFHAWEYSVEFSNAKLGCTMDKIDPMVIIKPGGSYKRG